MARDRDFDMYRRQQEALLEIQGKLRNSLKDNATYMNDMRKASASLLHIQGKIGQLEAEAKKATGTKKAQLEKEIEYNKKLKAEYQAQFDLMKGQVSVQGLLVAGFKDGFRAVQKFSKYFFEQDKAIRMSALSMGVLKNSSKAYFNNIVAAASVTNELGSSAADLAKMQAAYSDSIGRMVVLSKEGLVAMSEMAQGTTLGAEGAQQMAESMDMFGVSAIGARDKVQETLDIAHKMGISASKVLKNLQQNLKLGNQYNFKSGVKGIQEMAAYSEKLKINMQSVAGFADQVSNPEGAVEAAAKLQTLGGAWANLADPFQLMYQARNDMEGFTKSIAEATAGTFQFDRAAGEIKKSSLELSRLREIAKATNIPFQELADMSSRMAMSKSIDMDINPSIDPKYKDFIESAANWDKKKGGFVISVTPGIEQLVSSLDNDILKSYMGQKETLADRAKNSKTFDEQWTNVVNTFKNALLPFMSGIFDGLSTSLKGFLDWANSGDMFKKMSDFGEKVGAIIGEGIKTLGSAVQWLIKQTTEHPIIASVVGLTLVLGKLGIFEPLKWFANGMVLGKGFNMTAMAGGRGGAGGSMLGGLTKGSSLTSADRGFARSQVFGSGGGSISDRFGYAKMGTQMSPLAAMGISAGLGGLGMLASSQQSNYDPDSSTNKGYGMASSALGGASMGAMIGSMILGPGLGTLIGGAVGGLGGLAYGAYSESNKERTRGSGGDMKNYDDVYQATPSSKPVAIKKNNLDSVLSFKPGGAVSEGWGGGGSNKHEMSFSDKPIKIEFGEIQLKGDNGATLNSSTFTRQQTAEMARIMQIGIRSALPGIMAVKANQS